MTRKQAMAYRRIIEKAAVYLDDEYALEVPKIFKHWETAWPYHTGDRVFYENKLYKCLLDHTSQNDWTPDVAVSLWVEVALPGEIPVWKQPTGAHDAYNTGDKVHYPTQADPVYESIIDNNIWDPVSYPAGWRQV